MLDLRRDLYVRLATSAQKNRALNQRFREHVSLLRSFQKPDVAAEKKTIVDKLPQTKTIYPIHPILQKTPPKSVSIQRIEEKVRNIVDDPQLKAIREELNVAEVILKNLKNSGNDHPKIHSAEKTIYRLKAMLDQKTYI